MASLKKRSFVRWVDDKEHRVKPGTPGSRKVIEKSKKWYGQYRDANGSSKCVPLSPDKTAARQMLADLERQAERGKAGLIDPHADQRKAPILEQVDAYASHLKNKGVSAKHQAETIRRLKAVLDRCGIKALQDIKAEVLEHVLALQGEEGASARTRNTYRSSAKAFCRWCLKTRRLGEDPLATLDPVSGDVRRQRRAFTPEELARLFQAARARPLIEAQTIRRGQHAGEKLAKVRPEFEMELVRRGWERALMYKALAFTGLRRGELAALKVQHLDLNDPGHERLTLPGSLTKNRTEASIRLKAGLADDLRQWLAATGKAPADLVFRVPFELVKILKRDLMAAGISYRDDRGRTLDVHSFRHTTATYLALAKVTPRVAQGFMRHSTPELTMGVYTDLGLLNEHEALDAMPDIPLEAQPPAEPEKRNTKPRPAASA